MPDQQPYPLMYARVGSTLTNGRIDLSGVLEHPVTAFKQGGTGTTFMSGTSRYVHSDKMNKGSFGISGSYGVTGVKQVTASVSGYVGNATAQSSKSVSINYNALISAGVEHLDIAKLTIEDLINAMSPNPKRSLLRVLTNYNSLLEKVSDARKPGVAERNEFQKWSKSVTRFLSNYGDGLVVAVQWGAFGLVNMTLTSRDHGSTWKYGADADFTYSGVGGGVSVKACYAGSNSSSNAEVDVSVDSQFTGSAVRGLIDEWRQQVERKSFADLAEVDVLAQAPPLEVPPDRRPATPPFVKPPVDPKLTDQIGKIKTMEGLKAFAMAQAYDARADKDMTLAEFEAQAAELVGNDRVTELEEEIERPDFSAVTDGESATDAEPRVSAAERPSPAETAADRSQDVATAATASAALDEEFVPLGVLVCHWSDLFPWLARACDNRLDDLREAKLIVQWRTMIQDFQTLSMLYFTAHEAELLAVQRNLFPSTPGPDLKAVANEFLQGSAELQSIGKDADYEHCMRTAYEHLGPGAASIFKTWGEVGLLRQAELGLGFIAQDTGRQPESIRGVQKYGAGHALLLEPCSFVGSSKNYVAFSSFQKLLPIVLPEEAPAEGTRLMAFTDNGLMGYFSHGSRWGCVKTAVQVGGGQATFTPYEFEVDEREGCLRAKAASGLSLHPIPFRAAFGGVEWRGGAAGVASLASFEGLNREVAGLKKRLEKIPKFSFSGENFEDVETLTDLGLSELRVEEHYVGIIPEQQRVMRLFRGRGG